MKKYDVNVHFDLVKSIQIIANSEAEAESAAAEFAKNGELDVANDVDIMYSDTCCTDDNGKISAEDWKLYKIGSTVIWNDPDPENNFSDRIWSICLINGANTGKVQNDDDIILISDGISEAEVTISELTLLIQ